MNRIWNSVVGKLWVTILLLVSFVLFVFTVLMLEFLQNYHMQQAEISLRQTAATVASIVDDNETAESTSELLKDILPKGTNALIAISHVEVSFAMQEGVNKKKIQDTILANKSFREVFQSDEPIIKEMMMPSSTDPEKMESYVVLGFPLNVENAVHGAVFIYQSPDALHKTSKETTKIVFLAAFIAFVLTTFFAFFLSSRITSPLRKMRELAFEIAKGNFEAKMPTTQNDEIGQLAVAFNQMGRQLKHNLEVINQENEQLSNILTSMTDAVITFNRDRTILLSNPPAERLMQKWFVNKGSQSAKPIPPELYHMLDHVLMFEDKLEEEIEMDGNYYTFTISPLYSGEIIRGAVAVIRDMTEQHRLEKLRSDFIANVSHELRTPIAMLQGYSEALMDDDFIQDQEERNEITKIIYDESKRMGRLVTDLLDLARMESGHMTLYKDELPINSTFERITQKFAQVAKEKHVHLLFDSEFNDDAMINIDEDRIEQVLTNLVDNALRHTDEGSVTVKVEKEPTFAKISVQDTGHGIPQDDLPYVFERFYKADKARTRSKGGTGLGLAIARNIVKAHSGNIMVDSVLKEGTTFTFYLPFD
ncbi:ATP-binding protein [Lysinibacillus sp. fkY74-1]|uniref:histidine kinase n=3 Tax=Lysinibacillus TaxID=400634 RepID=W7RVW2_LYSSH|nr:MULTISPECIES: ATP-binding protein [Lysinibacillus]MBE5085304.1 HAMP domain-containing protein [Bacillus thuringiensis]AMO34478.1 histidine kinase [Lysinibacillus sphaericus]AMR90408.1 histidine kinase [Lysinibacillus sphaericus]ANA44457.1 histidine kinase [Lysinibacillus sphaericus]EWH34784.1 sensor histidine kinase [Lysinibacillus sphaericus CBAM5]